MITFFICSNDNISIEPSLVSKIEIANNLRGGVYIIEDASQIDKIVHMANDLHFRFGNKYNGKGYIYNIIFKDDKDSRIESFIIVDENHIKKNGYLYKSDCNEIKEYIDNVTK
jgi:hypothetical protein